jgi:hypothetical protein
MSVLDLGVMSFDAPQDWRFFPLDERIVGRPNDLPGVLNVMKVHGNALPQSVTHESSMSTARAAVQYELPDHGFDRAYDQLGNCVAGGESFLIDNDFIRIWYHHCAGGLVIAWFGCPKKAMEESAVRMLIRQCDQLIASVKLPGPERVAAVAGKRKLRH